jgi:pimeloyl-ACP methyl ester carboxylesterase
MKRAEHPPRIKCRKPILLSVIIILLASLSLAASCDEGLQRGEPTAGVAYEYFFRSSADGLEIPCTVYLPQGFNPSKSYPLLVELKALNGYPLVDNNDANIFSVELRTVADQNGWILICPWQRNMHSLYIDGINHNEPNIFDDFSSGAANWQPISGTWTATNGAYRQTSNSQSWTECLRQGSTGTNYCLRFKVNDLSTAATSRGIAINLHRNTSTNDAYRIELIKDAAGNEAVRLVKVQYGVQTQLFTGPQQWDPPAGETQTKIKFATHDNYLELAVNDDVVNLQQNDYEFNVYGWGKDVPQPFVSAGPVSLGTIGGAFEFDDVRLQNEYEYGERDTWDCVYGAMEKYNIDGRRVYVQGHSMGGAGTAIMMLHHPDFFAGGRSADAITDSYYDYMWYKDWYPEISVPGYVDRNDGRMAEFFENVAGGPISASTPDRMSILNENSARYILENEANNYWRINHGTLDLVVPNCHQQLTIEWAQPFWIYYQDVEAPAPYTYATPTYANGKDIYDILNAWSTAGPYSSVYLTDELGGHGFFEPYSDTAAAFATKTSNKNPTEVAYKTFDDKNTKAWWMQVQIPHPGANEPGMGRVKTNASANSSAIHCRNLTRMTLDLPWMGMNGGAGKTITFTLDDNTAPNVFTINDTTKAVTLDLKGSWSTGGGYTVKLDGNVLQAGANYTVTATSMVINNVAVSGGHTLTVQSPSTLPSNLAPNSSLETASGSTPANWSSEVQGSGNASFSLDTIESHIGSKSVRIKDANLTAANSRPVWKSSTIGVTQGKAYTVSAFNKARMFRGGNIGLGIAWYNSLNQLIKTDWSGTSPGSDYAFNRDWTPLSMQATAPSGSVRAAIVAGFQAPSIGQTSGSLWFDDFSMTQM